MTATVKPQIIHDRRATDRGLGGKVLSIEERLDKGDQRMGAIETTLTENTQATKEILEIVEMGRGFFRVLGYIGKAVKWAAGMAVAVGSVWALYTQGPKH